MPRQGALRSPADKQDKSSAKISKSSKSNSEQQNSLPNLLKLSIFRIIQIPQFLNFPELNEGFSNLLLNSCHMKEDTVLPIINSKNRIIGLGFGKVLPYQSQYRIRNTPRATNSLYFSTTQSPSCTFHSFTPEPVTTNIYTRRRRKIGEKMQFRATGRGNGKMPGSGCSRQV